MDYQDNYQAFTDRISYAHSHQHDIYDAALTLLHGNLHSFALKANIRTASYLDGALLKTENFPSGRTYSTSVETGYLLSSCGCDYSIYLMRGHLTDRIYSIGVRWTPKAWVIVKAYGSRLATGKENDLKPVIKDLGSDYTTNHLKWVIRELKKQFPGHPVVFLDPASRGAMNILIQIERPNIPTDQPFVLAVNHMTPQQTLQHVEVIAKKSEYLNWAAEKTYAIWRRQRALAQKCGFSPPKDPDGVFWEPVEIE